MTPVGGRPEEPERPVVGTETGEQEDGAAIPLVVPVPQAGGAVLTGDRLAFQWMRVRLIA